MRFLILFTLLTNLALADVDPADSICEEYFPMKENNLTDFQTILKHESLVPQNPYYLYFEGKELEDLQTLKNCIDYTMCGKYKESIVDDAKNYRVHLWKSMTVDQLNSLVRTCPIKDLSKKLVVRHQDQNGKPVNISKIKGEMLAQYKVTKDANPAFFHEPPQPISQAMVDLVKNYLSAKKTDEAEKIVLKTWGIDLHDYNLSFSHKPGSFAVTNHGLKTISYGSEWLKDPCDYIRMIRHEAEHVAQIKMAHSCPEHNFDDHQNRERAAHLNDARFMKNVCANTKAGESVRSFCLERFRNNYMKK